MLTPAFDLTQNDNFLILKIKAPYTKVSETEIFFEGTEFKFYSKPYFLRLNFPGSVTENGSESVKYNSEDGSYCIEMAKSCPGEWFQGLDLQTKLLAPRGKVSLPSLIQVVGAGNGNCEDGDEDVEEDYDWEVHQEQYTDDDDDHPLFSNFRYGFASLKTDAKLFSRLQEEMPDLLDIRIAEHTCPSKERMDTEAQDFCEQHYLADLYMVDIKDEMKKILWYEPTWIQLEQKLSQNPFLASEELVVFSEDEKAKMRSLPNKEYLLDHATKQAVLLSLVDILFAYAYNVRTTLGEHTVESAWTICKLSATLSWLQRFSSLEAVVVSCVRRSLCYPLYRRWDLAAIVIADVIRILTLGPRYVLKCLLDIHSLFNESDPRYILNDLYITDYCVWTQTIRSKTLMKLAEALKKMPVSKDKVDLELTILEQSAILALEEEDLDHRFDILRLESPSSQSSSSSVGRHSTSEHINECASDHIHKSVGDQETSSSSESDSSSSNSDSSSDNSDSSSESDSSLENSDSNQELSLSAEKPMIRCRKST